MVNSRDVMGHNFVFPNTSHFDEVIIVMTIIVGYVRNICCSSIFPSQTHGCMSIHGIKNYSFTSCGKNIRLVDVVFSCKKSMDFEPWVAHVHEINTFLETSPTYFGSFFPMSTLGSLDPFLFFYFFL